MIGSMIRMKTQNSTQNLLHKHIARNLYEMKANVVRKKRIKIPTQCSARSAMYNHAVVLVVVVVVEVIVVEIVVLRVVVIV